MILLRYKQKYNYNPEILYNGVSIMKSHLASQNALNLIMIINQLHGSVFCFPRTGMSLFHLFKHDT